jgi:methionyl-tRNA formyltransferase
MRLYLAGQGQFAATVAEHVTDVGHEIVGVASPSNRRGMDDDRHGPLGWDRLRAWAYPRRLPWTPSRAVRASHVPDDVDVIVAAHSHAFIGRATRARARYAIGYHPSLLPLHRGRDAIRWTVRDRDRVTGGTVYHLTDNVDGGPVAAQDWCHVPPGISAGELWREALAPMGVRLIVDVLDDIASGCVAWRPQDEALATWEPAMDAAPLFKPELPELPRGGADDG